MIKIVNVISDTNIGGAGKCIINFCKNYDKKKFDVVVVLPTKSKLIDELKQTSAKIIEIEGLKDKSWDVASLGKLIKILKKERPDIVHTHASSIARLAAKFVKNCKIIFTRHSVFPVNPKIKKGLGRLVYKTSNEFLSDRIIAVADAAKGNLVEGGINPNKIDVILNGVEKIKEISKDEKIKLKQKYNIKEDEYVVGILARLEEVKGHETFIEVADKLLNEKKIKAKFLILGTGTEEAKLKQKVKEMNLEKDIIFTGFVKNVQDFLNIFDVQVNCSFGTEATSLALLEGMSIGVPAVVTDFGGNPGVISDGENGYIVPIKSPEKTAEKIEKLLKDKDLMQEMQRKSIEIFKEKFTVEVYTQNLQKFYEKVYEQPKKKKINILDLIIVLIALITIGLGYTFINKEESVINNNLNKVVYSVKATSCLPVIEGYLEEGADVYDSLKNYHIGKIIEYKIEPNEVIVPDLESGTMKLNIIEDKVDVTLKIEANADISEKNIKIGEYDVKVGKEAYIRGKGFAMGGYIISIER